MTKQIQITDVDPVIVSKKIKVEIDNKWLEIDAVDFFDFIHGSDRNDPDKEQIIDMYDAGKWNGEDWVDCWRPKVITWEEALQEIEDYQFIRYLNSK